MKSFYSNIGAAIDEKDGINHSTNYLGSYFGGPILQ
jgi:hypothetical protein